MPKIKYPQENLTGVSFYNWLCIGETDRYAQLNGHTSPRVLVLKCKCGTVRSVLAANALRGRSKSCGCEQRRRASEVATARWEKYRQQQ